MMPKYTAKEAFLRKAYLYTKENGPMTIHELLEAVRINPNTKRVSAQIPTIRAACQYLTASKNSMSVWTLRQQSEADNTVSIFTKQ